MVPIAIEKYAQDLAGHRVLVPLTYHDKLLRETSLSSVSYLSKDKKDYLIVCFTNMLVSLSTEVQENFHSRKVYPDKFFASLQKLEKCSGILDELTNNNSPYLSSALPYHASTQYTSLLGYLGIHAAIYTSNTSNGEEEKTLQQLHADVKHFIEHNKLISPAKQRYNHTDIRYWVAITNDIRRLDWVAGSSIFSAVFDYLGNQNFHFTFETQLKAGMGTAARPMGMLSVFIYLYRFFGVELKEAIEHAVQTERVNKSLVHLPDEGVWQRFKRDIFGMRQFILLNDFLWTGVNSLCFLWLNNTNGPNMAMAGNFLTMSFLLVDSILVLVRWHKLSKAHMQEVAALNELIDEMNSKLENLKSDSLHDASDHDSHVHMYYKNSIKQAEATKKRLSDDWMLQKRQLQAELSLCASLIVAFTLMIMPTLVTTVTSVALMMSVIGAALWFTMTLVYNGVMVSQERTRLEKNIQERQEEIQSLLSDLKNQATDSLISPSTDQKKAYFYQIMSLVARNEDDRAQAKFMATRYALQTVADVLLPATVFLAMTTLAMPMALIPIGAALLVWGILKFAINHWSPKPRTGEFFDPSGGLDPTKKLERHYNKLCSKSDLTALEVGHFYLPTETVNSSDDAAEFGDGIGLSTLN